MSDWLLQLHWREPGWLALALLPLVFAVWRGRRRRGLRYADADLLPWAVQAPAAVAATWPRALAQALAWALLALAAAGPRLPLELQDGRATPRHRMTVMVLLDVSASMRATDTSPDRLARARLELLDWLARLHGERVGLIVYAGEAGLLLPPTDDAALLRRALDQADPGLIATPGTHLAAAIALARAQLDAAPGRSRALLLVSDADADSVVPAAQAAVDDLAAARLPLFVLGVGSVAGAPVPLADGGLAAGDDGAAATSRMDAATYRAWARASGGRFAAAVDGDADWVALHERGIAALPGDALALAAAPAWRELYAWCLVPALALWMALSLPRRAAPAALLALLAAGLAPPPAHADEAAAWQAWQQKHFARAQALYAAAGGYRGHLGAGAAAWRQADLAAAQRHFSAALLLAASAAERADALYNLGNAYYGRAQWPAAAEAFEAVLRLRPGDARARANLAAARQHLRRLRPGSPSASDLRGRRGFMVGGQVQTDVMTGRVPDDPESQAPGVGFDRRGSVAPGARGPGEAPAAGAATVDARLAASGQKKLERLQDRPEAMLKNLLQQDARGGDAAGPPW